ncbi:MAG TPA: hypothetical protein VKH64_14705 [Candidatus Binatia bacterium]|nr:hypothetical protein [Candidatus Binatia bacterium]
MNEPSTFELRLDIIWVSLLVQVLTAGHRGEAKPEVHLFLGDRYSRLSDRHERKGAKRKAARLRAEAEKHLRLGGWEPTLPPAAAMAMPIPRPALADVIGWRRQRPPDDAA